MAKGCKCAIRTDEYHGWECSITEGACVFLYPDSKACAEQYGEGPDVEETYEEIEKEMDGTTMGKISEMVKEAHETAVQHGWWDNPPEFGTTIALCHSELSETLEEYRKGKEPTETYYREDGKPEGIPSELADTVIRIMDICGYYGIDLETILSEKMEFNKTRSYRHGGKKI